MFWPHHGRNPLYSRRASNQLDLVPLTHRQSPRSRARQSRDHTVRLSALCVVNPDERVYGLSVAKRRQFRKGLRGRSSPVSEGASDVAADQDDGHAPSLFTLHLRSYVGESALWWSRRERHVGEPPQVRLWYGLGFSNTLPRCGYCWLEPRLNWEQVQFKSDITDHVLFGTECFTGSTSNAVDKYRRF